MKGLRWFTTKKKQILKYLEENSFGKYEQITQEPIEEKHVSQEPKVCLAADLQFSMHCKNCAMDVIKCCHKEKGVENVELHEDDKDSGKEKKLATVKVKGKFDLLMLTERLRRNHKIVIPVNIVDECILDGGDSTLVSVKGGPG